MDILAGIERNQIDWASFEAPIHKDLCSPLSHLKSRALREGFDLGIASGFRSVDAQIAIWNAKASGQRAVLDDNSQAIALDQLDDRQKIQSIMRWSALPGTSRHHWGSEVDVYDCSALKRGELHLVPEEFLSGGPCSDFYCWLQEELNTGDAVFFWPYAKDLGGVAPEPWHLSYAPLSCVLEQQLTESTLFDIVRSLDFLLKDSVLKNWEEIYMQFIEKITPYARHI